MTTLLIVSIITFLAVTLILVALLLVAKAKLTPQGNVKIDINNGERVLDVNPGSSLLTTLSNEKIFRSPAAAASCPPRWDSSPASSSRTTGGSDAR